MDWRTRICFVALAISTCIPICAQTKAPDGQDYFPRGVFAQAHTNGDFAAGWFSEQLRSLGEPSLMTPEATGEVVYRFLLLPSFSHPTSVRLTLHIDGTATVIVRVGSGAGGYTPKKLLSERKRLLSATEITKFLDVLKHQDFWVQPTEPPPSDSIGCDGTEWVMEGRADHYHVVDRWEGGTLRKLGTYMLETIGQVNLHGPI